VLLLVNGAPAVGKSALAERYARDHPLALVIDIDELRRRLGQWETTEASKAVARDLAVALAADHLRRGHDVVVPQYVGRREFVERLRAVAADARARFVEVIVTDDDDAIVERFRARRATLAATGARHPEGDLAEDQIATTVRTVNASLRADAAPRGLALIPAGDGVDGAYRALCAALFGNATTA
jgi:predicted kinase